MSSQSEVTEMENQPQSTYRKVSRLLSSSTLSHAILLASHLTSACFRLLDTWFPFTRQDTAAVSRLDSSQPTGRCLPHNTQAEEALR